MNENILSNIVLLNLDIRLWSGRRRLAPEDLKLADGSELPPESLARLGSKRVIDPERINELYQIRQEAHRIALRHGARLMGGYAIPTGRMAELKDQLDALVALGRKLKAELLSDLSAAVEEWKEKNPGWEALIDRADINPETVGRAISFSWQVYNIAPVEGQEEGLEAEINGLSGQLRQEIQTEARLLWKNSVQGKAEVTQRTLRPIRAMGKKLNGLAFLEPDLEDLVKEISDVLETLPKKGPIRGRHLAAVCGIVGLLGNIPDAKTMAEAAVKAEEEAAQKAIALKQQGSLLGSVETAVTETTDATEIPPAFVIQGAGEIYAGAAPPPPPPDECF